MLIQVLELQDRIYYSVGVKLVGSHLDRVSLETRRPRFVSFILFLDLVERLDSIYMLKFTYTHMFEVYWF